MPSTYSSLKFELIATGEQAGTWGNTTNINIGTAIEEAITGSATVTFTSGANTAIALTNTNAAQAARNLRLDLSGTMTTSQYLYVPAIEKFYIINNTLSNTVIVSNGSNAAATGTAVSVPRSTSVMLFNDGVNVTSAISHIPSLANVTITSGNATVTNLTATSANLTNANVTSVLTVAAGTNAAPSITTSGDTNTGIFFPAADTIAFTEGGVESMRIDSSGNVGIGTSSPAAKLDVTQSSSGAVVTGLMLRNPNSSVVGTGTKIYFSCVDANNRGSYIESASGASNATYLAFGTNAVGADATERLRIDSSGNLGLGVTPSAWATYKAMQMGTTTPFALDSSGAIGFNYYYDGAYKYVGTGVATLYSVAAGQHRWYTAPSGTAGNAITFTQAMTLTSAGELLVGGTTSISSHEAISVQRENATPVISTFRNDTSIASADLLGAIQFFGNDTTSNTPTALSYIYATASGTHAAGDNPTDIVFGTTPDGSATVAEAGRITQSGAYVLKGGTTTAAAGVGVIFPATQVASADANCLDDYEEGTFTPTIVGTTTAGTATYSVQVGRYTKVGNRVLFEVRVTYTGGTGTGNLRLAGLPFTSNANCQSSLAANYGNLVLTASNIAQCYVIGSSTSIAIEQYPTGGGAATSVAYDAAATILVAGHYEV